MKSLFRSFERNGVEYLLISGQASVLYGAALFSEDIDVWLRPAAANIDRFSKALEAVRATIYKLTPPLTVRNARFGHGFHFLVPSREGPVYLDVMGQPPRVGRFSAAVGRSTPMHTAWGRLAVVGIEDLVEIKKTRRLADYEIISRLVDVALARRSAPSTEELQWAAANSFRAEQRAAYLKRLGRDVSIDACRAEIAGELPALQKSDVEYWKPKIDELRRWRAASALWPQGARVTALGPR